MKFIVFAHHYEVLDQIEDLMLKSLTSYIRIDGQICMDKRYEAVLKFQTDPKCFVAILSLTSSSQGITLTAANTVVFAELTWTPGLMIQAEDRVHRIGQVKCVSVYYMIGEGTLDSLIYPRLKLKSSVISSVIDSGCPKTFEITNTLKLSVK